MAPYVPEEHVLSVGRLLPNDFAFVRRSGGKFCIAMVKSVQPDPEEGIVMDLYVNEAGATKSIPMSEWDSYIRPVKPHVICVSRVRGLGKNNRSSSLQVNGNRRASCPESESELDDCKIDEHVQHVKGNKSGCKQASDEHNEVHSGSSANPTRSLRDSKSTVNNSPNEDDAAPNRKDPSASPSSTPPSLCERVNEVNCSEDKRGSLNPSAGINAHHATVNNHKEPERQSSNNTCDTMHSSEAPNYGTTLKSSLRSTSSLRTSSISIIDAIPAIKEHANDNGDVSRHVQWDVSFQSQNENQSSSSDISKTADSEATSDAGVDEDTDSSDSFHHQPISSRRPFIMRRSETEHEADGRSYLYKQEVERSHKRATYISNSALASATTTKPTTYRNNTPLAKQKHSRRATTTDVDNSTPPKETQSRRASAGDAGDISKQPQRRGSMRNSTRGSLSSQNSLGRGLSDSQMFNESQLLSALASIRSEKETFDC